MTAVLLLGIGFGAGVLLIASGLFPARPPLLVALDRLHRPGFPADPEPAVPTGGSWSTRLLGASWTSSGIGRRLVANAAADLRVVGVSAEEHLAHRVAVAAVGVLWAPVLVLFLTLLGTSAPAGLSLWTSVVLAPVGFFVPGIELRARAARRRRSFRHALSSFLDVLAIGMAGGKGLEGALTEAAATGDGWAFRELRAALADARLLREPPWAGLARLGREMAVPELGELASSAALSGAEGARVKDSVAIKAKALRTRVLADVEAAAQSASERMSLPIVLLLLGFVLFLGYPAVTQVLGL